MWVMITVCMSNYSNEKIFFQLKNYFVTYYSVDKIYFFCILVIYNWRFKTTTDININTVLMKEFFTLSMAINKSTSSIMWHMNFKRVQSLHMNILNHSIHHIGNPLCSRFEPATYITMHAIQMRHLIKISKNN